jgi:lipopolysaccharide transport system permease protein
VAGKSATGPADFDIWIEAGRTEKNYWSDLWRYRELFLVLAWRDVAVRYKQTVAGIAWAIVQPAVTIAVMTLVFGKIAGLPSDGGSPYALMILAGILPWQFFANALTLGSQSIIMNSALVSKVYFPRLILPSSSFLVSLIDFLIACAILAILLAWYQIWPGWRLWMLPLLVAAAMISALGPALLTTALTVRYRDFRFLIPLLIQLGLYVSPVAYSSALAREKLGEGWYILYSLNPMVGVIDGFRWAILQTPGPFDWIGFTISLSISALLCAVGLVYFRSSERTFSDVI